MFRTVLLLIILFLSSSPTFAEVTKDDLREMEQRLKEYIDLKISVTDSKIKALETRIDEMDKRLTAEIEMANKRLTAEIEMVKWMVGVLIVIIVAILAIPQAVTLIRERKERKEVVELRERVTVLEKQLSLGASSR
jgi:beta-lactamase regulating signal transducer with metallopeptidase domain